MVISSPFSKLYRFILLSPLELARILPFGLKASEVISSLWFENSYNNYDQEGTVANIHTLIDKAIAFKNNRNVPVYCGEFGVYRPYSPNDDRTYWYSQVCKYLEANGIPWTTWDYQGDFGLFKQGSNELFNYDLNVQLVDSLGLNAPPQQVLEIKPDSTGFNIYTDYIAKNIVESSNPIGGTIDFYSHDKPNNGNYCIFWTGSAQYGWVGFDLVPNKDMSMLVNENYALSFLVRGNSPGTNIEARFIDSHRGIHRGNHCS